MGGGPKPLDLCSQPILRYIENLDGRDGERRIADDAEQLLSHFETTTRRTGVPEVAIKPARFALGVLLDQKVRQLSEIQLSRWSVLAHRQVFEGRQMDISRIAEFRDIAHRQGFDDLQAFLAEVIARAEHLRAGPQHHGSGGWSWRASAFVALFLVSLAGYAGALEYQYQLGLLQEFEQEALRTGLDLPQQGTELVRRLDALRAAVDRTFEASEHAPLRGALRLPIIDGADAAQTQYEEVVQRQVPGAIAQGIEQLLATEGDGLVLYDTLRAWSVLTGQDDWHQGYLVGWLQDHGDRVSLAGLWRHVGPLPGPYDMAPTDMLVMDQAREFAAQEPEADRAWLELLRSREMQSVAEWSAPTAVPGVDPVLIRRSGRSLAEPLPGVFTQAGWTAARQTGVGLAVQKARRIAPAITGMPLPPENRTPDLLLDRLHRETIAAWKAWLSDLRVRPFGDRGTAILVSGQLAQAQNPLTRLLSEVWLQAGGRDRSRTHEQQLLLASEFGPMIQYVEQGRMQQLSQIFSGLNVALGAVDIDARRANRRLMSFQEAARTVAALKSAPRIVVQIAEDVLVQSGRPDAAVTAANPLAQRWQQYAFPACHDAVTGAFPFQEGSDASLADVVAFFGPQGVLADFINNAARSLLQTDETPWRWNPEARFTGLRPESAAFLERSAQISAGLFSSDGTFGDVVSLVALAERGRTLVVVGGRAAPVRANGAPVSLAWPGPAPDAGIEVAFREGADAARLIHPGPWGLYRLIDQTRLRLRDEGSRALLDLRNREGRVFLELGFGDRLNPVSVRPLLKGLACPASL